MNSSASVNLVSNPELEKLFKSQPDIKAGDKLEARVTDLRSDGKAVLDFGKFQAAADLKVPVEVGDTVRLVVVEKAKQLKLKVEKIDSQQPPRCSKPCQASQRSPGTIPRRTTRAYR